MGNVLWSKRALKQLLTIDRRYRQAIKDKTAQLVAFPPVILDVKKLEGEENYHRLRVGDYRAIFELVQGKPLVLLIQQVKRRTSRTY